MIDNKPDFYDLVKQGCLKEEKNIGTDQIAKLLDRADKDLSTAHSLFDIDEGAVLSMVYSAVFHAANALIRLYGYRPGNIKQHYATIEAVKRILGEDYKDYIFWFNKLRVKRNEFEYQAIFNISRTQIDENLIEATKFVKIITTFISNKIDQQSFKLE